MITVLINITTMKSYQNYESYQNYQNYEKAIKTIKSYQKYEQLSKTGELNLFLQNLKNILHLSQLIFTKSEIYITYKLIYFSRILKTYYSYTDIFLFSAHNKFPFLTSFDKIFETSQSGKYNLFLQNFEK